MKVVKERPILFSREMVRAILEGRKTQTRRVVKLLDDGQFICERSRRWVTACEMKEGIGPWWHPHGGHPGEPMPRDRVATYCPYGSPGDRLWVKETWNGTRETGIVYLATNPELSGAPWRASVHMPRWASRITLEITGVRVERLQEISFEDCRAEGMSVSSVQEVQCDHPDCKGRHYGEKYHFQDVWTSVYGGGPWSWEQNPWVWVIEFKVIK